MPPVAPRVLPVGDRALLLELADLDGALGMFDALVAAGLPGVLELVPAARTVLARFDPLVTTADDLTRQVLGLEVDEATAPEGRTVEIGVHYDGEDLAEVAGLLGLSEPQVVEKHTGSDYRVAFGGFAPGFAYLTGGDPVFDVPRRSSPRTRIPAGAVGLAGTFSGVYPRESPGGWQIIGHTGDSMWDLDRDPPALLQPGDRVRFVDLDAAASSIEPVPLIEPVEIPAQGSDPPVPQVAPVEIPAQGRDTLDQRTWPAGRNPDLLDPRIPQLQIVHPGALALLEDEGRPGLATIGVAHAGALDRRSLHTANRLVGNPVDTAVIEFSFGGTVRAIGDLVVAVAGERLTLTVSTADQQVIDVDDQRPIALHDGDTLSLMPTLGARGYFAVRGGFHVPAVLGSHSTDTMSRIGPPALAAGTVLAVGGRTGLAPVQDAQSWPGRLASQLIELPVLLGPRDDWFTAEAIALLLEQNWTVTPRSDRVGVRLAGDVPLERSVHRELPSEGAVSGALQVPADGQPLLFLADHPVTGGYPVIAVLQWTALDLAGQLAPGSIVRFTRSRAATPAPLPGAGTGRLQPLPSEP